MSNKKLGMYGMVLGALIVVSNVIVGIFGWHWLAAMVGYPSSGFGWRKITLIVLGLVMVIISYILNKAGNRVEK